MGKTKGMGPQAVGKRVRARERLLPSGLFPRLIRLNNFPHSLGSERQHVLIKFADDTELGSCFNSEC